MIFLSLFLLQNRHLEKHRTPDMGDDGIFVLIQRSYNLITDSRYSSAWLTTQFKSQKRDGASYSLANISFKSSSLTRSRDKYGNSVLSTFSPIADVMGRTCLTRP